ncbi:MAG: patatin-like phospholipase family protein [Alphaproteobacteria bacterium]|nr:patatin-like phospholipase family protein [Alphaproteobacteria bacterium]
MTDNRLDYFKRWMPKPAATAAAQGARLMNTVLRPRASDALAFYPKELKDRLASFPIAQNIGERALAELLLHAQWFSLPGGAVLTREGDNDQAVFIVVGGSLGVFTNDDKGNDHFVANVPAGETVGEMSVIAGDAHAAKLVALRDSELLRIGKRQFEILLARHPRLSMNLMRLLVRRLRQTTRRSTKVQHARTIALVPLHAGIDRRALGASLERAFAAMGIKAGVLAHDTASGEGDWYARFEHDHDIVLYLGEASESQWTQLCLRQADRIFLVARAGETLPNHWRTPESLGRLKRQLPELLLLKTSNAPGISDTPGGMNGPYGLHHYVRENDSSDIARFARMLAGRAVGLVLAGGGARGFAHVGVIKALRQADVPFDIIGGASMGAVVAAGVAMGWDHEELSRRVRHAFVQSNPLSDFTLPLVAVLRGKKVTRLLHEHFGDMRIEDLHRTFFCVSSNLTLGRANIHNDGLVWRALRATVAIPGLLPPVIQEKNLLVDGGLMNNFPVDVMTTYAQGPVIGVDVAGNENLVVEAENFSEQPWLKLFQQQRRGAPSIVSILMRSGTVGNETQRRQAREQTDLLFDPPMPGIGLRSWKSFDQAVEAGYAHASRLIDADGLAVLGASRGQTHA